MDAEAVDDTAADMAVLALLLAGDVALDDGGGYCQCKRPVPQDVVVVVMEEDAVDDKRQKSLVAETADGNKRL